MEAILNHPLVQEFNQFKNSFQWKSGETFLSNPVHVGGLLVGYVTLSFLIQFLMKNSKPANVTGLVVIHNGGLCIASFVMGLGALIDVIQVANNYYSDDVAHGLICDEKTRFWSSSSLQFWSYLYYLSKYWEMIDTFILALKKKPLTFLQMYHHNIIVLLCWSWLETAWPLHWVAIVLNTTVHVFMYYYFALSALGVNVWWKKFLTGGQLLQFSIVFTSIMVWYYISLKDLTFSSSFPFVSYSSSVCAGAVWTVNFSQVVNITFLYLFGEFYVRNYLSGKKDGAGKQGKRDKSSKETDATKSKAE